MPLEVKNDKLSIKQEWKKSLKFNSSFVDISPKPSLMQRFFKKFDNSFVIYYEFIDNNWEKHFFKRKKNDKEFERCLYVSDVSRLLK